MVLAELAAYLGTQSIGTSNIFYGKVPPDPDIAIVLFEYGGLPNEPDMGTGNTRLVFPLIQVLTRGIKDDYDGPRLLAQNVVTAFTKVVNQNLSGIAYKAIEPKQDPFFLRRDNNFRVEIVCNYKVTKGYSAT